MWLYSQQFICLAGKIFVRLRQRSWHRTGRRMPQERLERWSTRATLSKPFIRKCARKFLMRLLYKIPYCNSNSLYFAGKLKLIAAKKIVAANRSTNGIVFWHMILKMIAKASSWIGSFFHPVVYAGASRS